MFAVGVVVVEYDRSSRAVGGGVWLLSRMGKAERHVARGERIGKLSS